MNKMDGINKYSEGSIKSFRSSSFANLRAISCWRRSAGRRGKKWLGSISPFSFLRYDMDRKSQADDDENDTSYQYTLFKKFSFF